MIVSTSPRLTSVLSSEIVGGKNMPLMIVDTPGVMYMLYVWVSDLFFCALSAHTLNVYGPDCKPVTIAWKFASGPADVVSICSVFFNTCTELPGYALPLNIACVGTPG